MDENLAEKYNTRKISDRLLRKRSPIKTAVNDNLRKQIKRENVTGQNPSNRNEICVLDLEDDEISNEIEEIMVAEGKEDKMKQEHVESDNKKKMREQISQADFLKQLIGRIDYSLIVNEENRESKG